MNLKNICFFSLLCLSLTIPINSFSSDTNALKKLSSFSRSFSARGFTCRNTANGRYLRQGQSYTIYTTLYRENIYRLVAAGNIHVKDIDIILHDENHGLISKDKSADPTPIVSVTPKWTGKFHAKVKMHRGRGYSNLMVCWKRR